jgi:hypothetical protein
MVGKQKKTQLTEKQLIGFLTCDPGGIQTPNPQSRNLMRYSIAPRSLFFSEWLN